MLIHVEPEALQQTGVRMELIAQDMRDSIGVLRVAAERLGMDWQGGSRQVEMLDSLNQRIYALRRLVAQLEQLASRLRLEGSRWEDTDLSWVHHYSGN